MKLNTFSYSNCHKLLRNTRKIPVINTVKITAGVNCQQSARKYYSLVGLGLGLQLLCRLELVLRLESV